MRSNVVGKNAFGAAALVPISESSAEVWNLKLTVE